MILLQKMGLNDVTLLFGQRFEYDRYLMGSVVDDAYVIEQRDSTIPIEKYPHSVTITADDQKKLNQVTRGRSTDLLLESGKRIMRVYLKTSKDYQIR